MKFSNKDLKRLIIPLLIEQLLAIAVGMLDIIMVARVGEMAMAGVSLVDNISILLIQVFAALATGGAVVASQFIGRDDKKNACVAANQLILSITVISTVIMIIALIGRSSILYFVFGQIEPGVMANAESYFWITAISYPFLAVYNGCSALFRAMGNSKISMKASIFMNIINVTGNAIFIFGMQMGAAGAALGTLIARVIGAMLMLYLIRDPENPIHIHPRFHLGVNFRMIKHIMSIGIPNGLENGMFQVGRLVLSSLISTFGTVAISANAVGNTVSSLQILTGQAFGLALITVVGQCVGAGDHKQAMVYIKKLMVWTYVLQGIATLLICLGLPWILALYNLSPETEALATTLIWFHSLASIPLWPASFALPNALRASNDARYAMTVSIFSMLFCRITIGFFLAKYMNMGVMGVWIAMSIDWICRSIFYVARFINGKWKHASAW